MQLSNWMWLNPSVKGYKPHRSENCCNSYFKLHQTRWDWGNGCERFECWNFSWFVPSLQETVGLVHQKWLVCLRTDKLCYASDEFIKGQCRGPSHAAGWAGGAAEGRAGDRWDNQPCGSLSPASGESISQVKPCLVTVWSVLMHSNAVSCC